jgi:L-lactate utilization protein LutC
MGRAHRVKSIDIPAGAGYVGAGDDLCAALAAEIEAVGGTAVVVERTDGAKEQVASLLEQYSPKSAVLWQHAVLERLDVYSLLDSRGAKWHDHRSLSQLDSKEQRAAILAADIGISSVDFAVAETGTLAVCSKPGRERVISLLPPVHIAIVEESQIVPDLFDVFSELAKLDFDELASNLAFVTGPSKTGDIELQLTTGVHGPGKWHVIIIAT